MAKVSFKMGLSSAYQGLELKDANTFYYLTDTKVLYLGEDKIGADSTIEATVKALQTTVNTLNGEASVNGSVKKQIKDAIDALKTDVIGNLEDLSTTVKDKVVTAINSLKTALDTTDGKVTELSGKIGNTTTLTTTSKEVVGAINELAGEVTKFSSQEAVKVTKKDTATEGAAVTYDVTQGGKSVGTIDVPKDMVVSKAEVKTLIKPDEQEHQPGTYIVLTIANKEDSELWIDAGKLVDIYTASTEESNVKITIDQSANTIKAEIEAGKITATEIANATITKAKLATDVTGSLSKADSALQAADVVEGTTNGAISVKGAAVKVHGLGDLATTNKEDLGLDEYAKTAELGDLASKNQTDIDKLYDKTGAAAAAQTAATNAAKTYTDSQLEWGAIE